MTRDNAAARDGAEVQEALHAYLDARTYSHRTTDGGLDAGYRADVDAFFDLARRAGTGVHVERKVNMRSAVSMTPPAQAFDSIGLGTSAESGGREWMVPRSRPATWLSVSVVALLLMGTIGGAWWFGPGRGDDEPLQLAAMVNDEGTPEAYWPDPLNPVDDPWVASIVPEECTAEPMPYEDFAAAKTTDPGPPSGSFEIVGVPDAADAHAVVTTLRSWSACYETGNVDKIRAYLTDEYLFFEGTSIDNQPYTQVVADRQAEASIAWTQWAMDVGLYPMVIAEGLDIPADATARFEESQAILDGGAAVSTTGQVLNPATGGIGAYWEVRWNPDDAVLLADGRIMVPTTYLTYQEDPWLQEYGYGAPGQLNISVTAMVLENVDGEWAIDERASIYICAGGCDLSLLESGNLPWNGESATPAAQPVATPES